MPLDACAFLDPAAPTAAATLTTYRAQAELTQSLIAHAALNQLEEVPANEALLPLCPDRNTIRPLYGVRVGRLDSNHLTMAGALTAASFAAAVFTPADLQFDFAAPELDPYLHALLAAERAAIVRVADQPGARAEDVYTAARRFKHLPLALLPARPADWIPALDVVGRARQRGDATLLLCSGPAAAADVATALKALPLERVLFASGAHLADEHAADRTCAFLEDLRSRVAPDVFDRFTRANARMWLQLS